MARARSEPVPRRLGTRPANAVPQKASGRHRRAGPRDVSRGGGLWWGLFVCIAVFAAGYLYLSAGLIDLRDPGQVQRRPSVTVLDRANVPVASFGEVHGEWLGYDEFSPWLPRAVVAVEDRRFFGHIGLDPIGIARALWRNIQAGQVVEGGSTITQQLAKVAFLTPDRSLSRKLKEAAYALWLELRFDKETLLEIYLNRIYLGGGAYGADGAARRYFAKSARELTLAESAMLAGLIRAPSRFAPTRDLALAQSRAALALDTMVDTGAITPEEAEAAKADPATLASSAEGFTGRYFAEWLYGDVQAFADEDHPDVVVRSTLDRRLQAAAETAVNEAFAAAGSVARPAEAALVAMTSSGEVLAMVGGRDYGASQYNRAVQARRQPGSAFKLFVYLAALEAGWAPDDPVSGLPVNVDGWRPVNFDKAYPERLTVAQSFARSVNTAAVRLGEQVGRDRVVEMARRLGISGPLASTPSVLLGASGVSLLELTSAYATVAAGGQAAWPSGVFAVSEPDGDVLYRHDADSSAVLSPAVAADMLGMLRDVVTVGTGRAAEPADRRPVAGKTGTSSGNRDAWFVGFTGEMVVGVWVGRDDGAPMPGIGGGGLPAAIFARFTGDALEGTAARPLMPPVPSARPEGGLLAHLPDTRSYTLDEAKQSLEAVVEGVFDRIGSWLGD